MSEEEKIISYLQFCAESYKMTTKEKDKDNPFFVAIKVIEKQQKEIEELKKDKKVLVENYDKVLGTFISKDKIREKIKELPTWLTEEEKRGIKFFVNELLKEK